MSMGLENAYGANEFQKALRQRILENLAQEQQKFQNSMTVRGADRADRQQQILEDEHAASLKERSMLTNEKIAGDTAANLSPNAIVAPEMGQRFAGTSLAPLLKPDATLPSTQLAAGVPMVGADTASTAPVVTDKPSVLTGQLRFTGTPKQVADENQKALVGRLVSSLPANSHERKSLEYEQATGKNPPAGVFDKPTQPGVIHDTANGLVRIGDDNSITPLTAGGKPVVGYHAPVSANPNDASAIADAIESGIQPPDTKGLFRLAGPVRAELAKRGYDLSTANLDWQATQKHLATLNGPQQTRLRQAIGTATDSLDVIQQLTDAWDGGRFPILNKANLAIAKNGGYGKEAASIATQLEGQITDVVSELGNIYMGGNAPTDHALVLAQKNLSADWDRKVLTDMIALARKNIQIRANSIANAGAVTASSQQAPAGGSTTPPTKLSADDLLKKYGR